MTAVAAVGWVNTGQDLLSAEYELFTSFPHANSSQQALPGTDLQLLPPDPCKYEYGAPLPIGGCLVAVAP